jgi:DNA-binding beta-propeller fold protein YncE
VQYGEAKEFDPGRERVNNTMNNQVSVSSDMNIEERFMMRQIIKLASISMVLCLFNIHPAFSQDFAAVPGERGGQDITGPYDVVPGWPKDISSLPGHEDWTWGAGQSVFAESSDRIYVLQRGELPNIERPERKPIFDTGPGIYFPIGRLPWRDATVSSMPANGAAGTLAEEAMAVWEANGGRQGIDARWEHCILVLNGEGEIIEAWTQWDSMLQRPHFIAINPYDPEKHVWVVDDHKHVIHKFSNDGSKLVQTIGTYGEFGDDETHFNRPSFLAWLPDSSFFVADGYNGHRVVKFDKNGNYLLSWGKKADGSRNDRRPGYFHNVHGIAVDPKTNRVFVNDRYNHRVQVFDENGKYLDEWRFGDTPSDVHLFNITADGYLWAADRGTNKILKYSLDGQFLYSWGTWGDFPGGMWGVHGMSVDEEGIFYISEVDNGGVQKYTPRKGANPDFLMGPPVRDAW